MNIMSSADAAIKWNISFYYQRILASRDKDSVAAEIDALEPRPEYEKIIKDPYVLEFLDLPDNEHYYESELEQALIDLQKFLLDLGSLFRANKEAKGQPPQRAALPSYIHIALFY